VQLQLVDGVNEDFAYRADEGVPGRLATAATRRAGSLERVEMRPGSEMVRRCLVVALAVWGLGACEGEVGEAECADGARIAESALCDGNYDCPDRGDEADCRYNGSSDDHPIREWDFDALAAMQSAVDGSPNADARFIEAALSTGLTAAQLDRIGTIDWSRATASSLLRDEDLGRAFRAILAHYEAERGPDARRDGLREESFGSSTEALVESCADATAEVSPGIDSAIEIVSGTVLAGTGAFALSAAVCVASVVCGVIAATAVVAGVVMALGGVSGAAIERLALSQACASEDGICGTCTEGDCTCPAYCPAPAGCDSAPTDAGPDVPDGGADAATGPMLNCDTNNDGDLDTLCEGATPLCFITCGCHPEGSTMCRLCISPGSGVICAPTDVCHYGGTDEAVCGGPGSFRCEHPDGRPRRYIDVCESNEECFFQGDDRGFCWQEGERIQCGPDLEGRYWTCDVPQTCGARYLECS